MSAPDRPNFAIDYVEFPVKDVASAKKFYGDVFEWWFRDYGSDYASFHDSRITGGFAKVDEMPTGGPLVVVYASDLAATRSKVLDAGGTVTKEIFEFPGGRRFHFTDCCGNELAVWSE